MTLIIAAHAAKHEKPGIWFAADSMISRGTVVLCEYRKTHEVRVRINAPRFERDHIVDFGKVICDVPIIVGFAGDLTTAHHILNQISDHLSNLIAYMDTEGNPSLVMKCEFSISKELGNRLPSNKQDFKSSIKLLDSKFIAGVVEHSFNLALQSGRRYKINEDEIRNLNAQFVVGLQCPKEMSFHLYRISPDFPSPDYLPEISMTEVKPGKVVTIGVAGQDSDVQACRDRACAAGEDLGEGLFRHLVKLVDSHEVDSIGHPCVLKKFSGSGIETVKLTKLTPGAGEANANLKGQDHVPSDF